MPGGQGNSESPRGSPSTLLHLPDLPGLTSEFSLASLELYQSSLRKIAMSHFAICIESQIAGTLAASSETKKKTKQGNST